MTSPPITPSTVNVDRAFAIITALVQLALGYADYSRRSLKMTREPTAEVFWACRAAKEAMLLAIEAVDDVLDGDSSALEHPELVTAFMAFAGHAYHAKATQYH
jgi:hypothetical protein